MWGQCRTAGKGTRKIAGGVCLHRTLRIQEQQLHLQLWWRPGDLAEPGSSAVVVAASAAAAAAAPLLLLLLLLLLPWLTSLMLQESTKVLIKCPKCGAITCSPTCTETHQAQDCEQDPVSRVSRVCVLRQGPRVWGFGRPAAGCAL